MAHLLCPKHGEERRKSLREQPLDDFDGYGTVLAHGKLISGPWQCDICDKKLNEGDNVFFVNNLAQDELDDFEWYDFGYEREYLNIHAGNVELFGREMPEGMNFDFKEEDK